MGSGSFLKVLVSNLDVLAGYALLLSPWSASSYLLGRIGFEFLVWMACRRCRSSRSMSSVQRAKGKRARIMASVL
jgi:threonine/homoserine/homoserine lactone efflux protein